MKDFGLAHFLERFSFRNPKSIKTFENSEGRPSVCRQCYKPAEARTLPVKLLTDANCAEEDEYIVKYFNQKRNNGSSTMQVEENIDANESSDFDYEKIEEQLRFNEVNDEEFEDYLDCYFRCKNKAPYIPASVGVEKIEFINNAEQSPEDNGINVFEEELDNDDSFSENYMTSVEEDITDDEEENISDMESSPDELPDVETGDESDCRPSHSNFVDVEDKSTDEDDDAHIYERVSRKRVKRRQQDGGNQSYKKLKMDSSK